MPQQGNPTKLLDKVYYVGNAGRTYDVSADGQHDLRVPRGNRLEALKGPMAGRYSIRVNDQYRITFRFEAGHAREVICED